MTLLIVNAYLVTHRGIAASAPILQFTGLTNCLAFGKIVTGDYEKESKECSESIRRSWAFIDTLGDTGESNGRESVQV